MKKFIDQLDQLVLHSSKRNHSVSLCNYIKHVHACDVWEFHQTVQVTINKR